MICILSEEITNLHNVTFEIIIDIINNQWNCRNFVTPCRIGKLNWRTSHPLFFRYRKHRRTDWFSPSSFVCGDYPRIHIYKSIEFQCKTINIFSYVKKITVHNHRSIGKYKCMLTLKIFRSRWKESYLVVGLLYTETGGVNLVLLQIIE